MQCQICNKRTATVHFTQIVNNKKVEMHLCHQCAEEKGGYGFGLPLNISSFFASLLGFNEKQPYVQQMHRTTSCPKCGMTFEEFQRSGKVGCNNCYDVFEDNLNPLIRRLQGSIEHNGKVPARLSKSISISREISRLKELLLKAVEKEEYEKAAEIRDKIKSLEVGLK
jgi:protein arginine kinase activator